jgi:hypothetical protein
MEHDGDRTLLQQACQVVLMIALVGKLEIRGLGTQPKTGRGVIFLSTRE